MKRSSPHGRRRGSERLRHGDWLLLKTEEIQVDCFYWWVKGPKRKSGGRKNVVGPHLELKTPSGVLFLRGKRALWSLLDSIFHKDPLPRTPVNNDFKKDAQEATLILQALFQDPDAWPFLRLNVKDGIFRHPFGGDLEGTWIHAATPASSERDLTPDLQHLSVEMGGIIMPLDIVLRDRIATIPAFFLRCGEKGTVVVTDNINGNHVVFSRFSHGECSFRPSRSMKIAVGKTEDLVNEVRRRVKELSLFFSCEIEVPELRPLNPHMRFSEVDDIEHRRFLSIPGITEFLTKGVVGLCFHDDDDGKQ